MPQNGTHYAFKKQKDGQNFLFNYTDIFLKRPSYLIYIHLLTIDFQCIEKDLLFPRTI